MLDPSHYETIAIEIQERIATLTLNRPEQRNAVNDVMHAELSTVFDDASRDDRVDVVVLTGAGRVFSAGGDTNPEREYRSKTGRSVMQDARHIVEDLIALEKPLIAAVNGHAVGLGATLSSLADVSFMAAGGRFGDPHVLAAIPAGNGSAVIWPLLIGVNRAKYLLMSGELIGAEEACALGLVTKVVPDGPAAVAAAMDYARRLAALAPQAVQGTKAAVNKLLSSAARASLTTSLALEELAMQQPAFHQALQALSAGRPAS